MPPNIQILANSEKMELFWDTDPDNSIQSFNLYWAISKDTNNFVTGSPGLPIFGDTGGLTGILGSTGGTTGIGTTGSVTGPGPGFGLTGGTTGIQGLTGTQSVLGLTGGTTGVLGTTGYTIAREFENFTLLEEHIPNQKIFDRKYTYSRFNKSDIGMDDNNPFYVLITAQGETGVESEPGDVRLIPFLSDQPAEAGGAHSTITKSENFSQIVGTSPIRVTFGEDARVIELFNYNLSATVFVDISGFDASSSSGMVMMPNTYYVIDRHIDKDTGFSMISNVANTDVRVVVHY